MKLLIPHEEIVEMCQNIATDINNQFQGKSPIVVCVLKGACPFHSELIKHITLPIEVDYIQVSSYSGTKSTGKVKIKKDLDMDIKDRDVIIVEDIIDTGLTLNKLIEELQNRNPSSISVVTMLDKPSNRKIEFNADYIGRTIGNLFVIGFGLDLDEKYRNLRDIYIFDEE